VGEISCTEGRRSAQALFPTPKRPITTDVAIEGRPGELERILRLSGLAGEGVVKVGLVEKGGAVGLETAVHGRTYDFGRVPVRQWTAIVAFDEAGKQVYREPLAIRRMPLAPPRARPTKPRPLPPLTRLPETPAVQHADVAGATVDVYRSRLVAVRLTSSTTRAYRLLQPPASTSAAPSPYRYVSVECGNVAYGAGRWVALGSGATARFRRDLRVLVAGDFEAPSVPFDYCLVRGTYGRRWDDGRGTHEAVEAGFTALGRRFLAERATARDLALFVRTPQMLAIRAAMRSGTLAPSADAIARRFPRRVVALASRRATPPAGVVGVWSDRKQLLVTVERATDGRRLYVLLPRGRRGAHNLRELAFVY
jgi:hypothetical protein